LHEENAAEDEFSLEKVVKYAKRAKDKGDLESARNAERELNLLNPIVGGPHIWKWCLENLNKPFPRWSKEDIEYYRKRYSESTDSLDRARYAYAIWTLDKDIEFAKNAVTEFLVSGDLYYTRSWYKNGTKYTVMAYCFEFASKMSLSLGLASPLDITSIMRKWSHVIHDMNLRNEMGRGIFDLLKVMAKIADDLYDNRELARRQEIQRIFLDILSIADRIGGQWHQRNEFHWHRSYLEISMPLVKVTQEPEKIRDLKIEVADSYVEQAELSASSGIVKVAYYEDALKIYSELGLAQQMEKTRKRIAECSKKAETEFAEISVPVKIPTHQIVAGQIEKFVGQPPGQVLRQIAHDMTFIPKKEKVAQTVEAIRKEAPLSFIIPITVYERGLPRKKITEEKAIFEYKVKRQFLVESQIYGKIHVEVLKTAFEVFVNKDDLLEFIQNSRNVTVNSMQMLRGGIQHHFRREYFASIHIFVPQVEEIVRTLMVNRGMAPTKYDVVEEGVQDKLLGGLLEEADQFLGEDFAEYLRIRLLPEGENIRNKVCHGWMESEKLDEELSLVLLDMILKLSVL